MSAIVYIATLLSQIGMFLHDVADEAWDIPSVGHRLYHLFNDVANRFYDGDEEFSPSEYCLYSRFMELNSWALGVIAAIGNILDWESIQALILGWLTDLELLMAWFSNWWDNVQDVIGAWWATTSLTVQGWIDAAVASIGDLVADLEDYLGELRGEWDEFALKLPAIGEVLDWFRDPAGNILAIVTTWWAATMGQVQELIASELREWFPFYDDLAATWSDIASFFSGPLDFLWDRFADWFLGPGE